MPSVLVLDNDPIVCKFMETFLSAEHNAIACTTWDSALTVLKDVQFDLILLDIHLGERRGDELVAEVRKYQRGLVVLFSASSKDYIMARCREFMADGYVQKTLVPEMMNQTLEPFLREKICQPPALTERSFFESALAWDEASE